MSEYVTKQRKILLDFFDKHIDEAVSAQQIASSLEKENISVSAVYRNLTALEKSGKLQRISHADSREAFYRYSAHEQCKDNLHLSCKKCGKTFHLNHDGADKIVAALSDEEHFALDKTDTILYGICKNCNK